MNLRLYCHLSLTWIQHQLSIQSFLYAFDNPGMVFAVSPGILLAEMP